jgi:hypothetical protein
MPTRRRPKVASGASCRSQASKRPLSPKATYPASGGDQVQYGLFWRARQDVVSEDETHLLLIPSNRRKHE